MAISYVSGASANSSTVSVTGVQVGDLIVVAANSGMSETPPSLPAGWTSLATGSYGAPTAVRLGYKVATAGGTQDAGTWTGATSVTAGVWRGTGNPSKGAVDISGSPGLSGLASGAWVGLLVAGGSGVGPAAAGLTFHAKAKTASFYEVLQPAADKPLKPAGEWNASRIVILSEPGARRPAKVRYPEPGGC